MMPSTTRSHMQSNNRVAASQRRKTEPYTTATNHINTPTHRYLGNSRSLLKRDDMSVPQPYRNQLSRDYGISLDLLRIHAGQNGRNRAAQDNAVAVSQGRDIYFSPNTFRPDTEQGKKVLRHEVAHYAQRYLPGTGQTVPTQSLETEADAAASRTEGRVTIRGRAEPHKTLYMKTFVSTKGSSIYLNNAAKFYKLWENETAVRVDSYQQIVTALAKDTKALQNFRIVSHANDYNLFLPLLHGGKAYASLDMLGLQTRAATATFFGDKSHMITTDMSGDIHSWLVSDAKGKALLTKLGQVTGFSGLLREIVRWAVDYYFVANTIENAPAKGSGQKKSSKLEIAALKREINAIHQAVKAAATANLPKTASSTDIDTLRQQTISALGTRKWSWPNMPPGTFKDRLDKLRDPDRVSLRNEIASGKMESDLVKVKKRVNTNTHIEIRGCNIGTNTSYLNGIRAYFGTNPGALPSISAPTLYQFFGTPGLQVLPHGRKAPPINKSLKFLLEENFDDSDTLPAVQAALKAAKLTSMSDLAQILRYADVKDEFESWWKMQQRNTAQSRYDKAARTATTAAKAQLKSQLNKDIAAINSKSATLKDFVAYMQTQKKTFPMNAPGVSSAESLWYLLLLPGSAVDALVTFVEEQGYSLPGGKKIKDRFFKRVGRLNSKRARRRFTAGAGKIYVDWLGDNYPVPDKIYFQADPEYKKSFKKLP